nr:three-Cys-motif partner protein TcmP [uncultured Carboxylicivirga sp.]
MADKFHIQPFDEGTLVKLELLKLYVRGWLPVFITRHNIVWKDIFIYDFFSGAGKDSTGKFGSPLIILNELRGYCPSIMEKGLKVRLLFNELQQDVSENLKSNVADFFTQCQAKNEFSCCIKCSTENKCPFAVTIEQKEFKQLFNESYPTMDMHAEMPRFMFLDQFGIKQITQDIFRKLTGLKRTDFLFFISSSFVRRFSEMDEFKRYLQVSKQNFDESQPEHCHRIILNYYKSLTKDQNYYIAPFSIKKNKNIYGLIFGSNSSLGMEKYLDAAWSIDRDTGEANFNIDNDTILTGQPSLFPEENVVKKVDVFERNLIEWLKTGARSNHEIYLYTLAHGMRKTHTSEILKRNQKRLSITSNDKIRNGYFYLGYKHEKYIKIKINE